MRISERQLMELIDLVSVCCVLQNISLSDSGRERGCKLLNEIIQQQNNKLINIGELEEVKDGSI